MCGKWLVSWWKYFIAGLSMNTWRLVERGNTRQGGGGYEPQQAGRVAHGRGGGAAASHRSPMCHARTARGIGAVDRPPAAQILRPGEAPNVLESVKRWWKCRGVKHPG
ncbi:hypothetical protein AT05_08280 [Schleiferia thermophila str. Yellowstone]|nr:hypothetical protein AT05_08280 [Schleiferia thermophila str. Yellowstone]